MSIITPVTTFSTQDMVDSLNKDLILEVKSKYGGKTNYIDQYVVVNDQVILPFAYGVKLGLQRSEREHFAGITAKCIKPPRDQDQLDVINEATSQLNKTGSILISGCTGFGKTYCAIKLMCRIKLKTLIITKGLKLLTQWQDELTEYAPDCKTQILKPKSKFDPDCDCYIINAQNVVKFDKDIFSNVGVVFVDEAHLIMAEALARSLRYIYPRYLVGLTATPYRPDGLDRLFDLYFGEYKIIRELNRSHIVYKVSTGFVPTVEYTVMGGKKTPVWGSVLKSQAEDINRNELIIKIIKHFSDRNFIILVKRVTQAKYLYNRLLLDKESITELTGSDTEFDKDARILVGTVNKLGVGFNHPKLDALLLAGDVEEYFIQYLGRVFRRPDIEPIIFDLVDKYGLLTKHFNTRREIYEKHGGIIKDFDLSCLN